MAQADQHTFQVLTKRPQRMAAYVTDHCRCLGGGHPSGTHLRSALSWVGTPGSPRYVAGVDGHVVYHQRPWPLANVWLGTSIEFDKYTWRADHLRATPAAVRFLSLEPLLGPLPSLDLTGIDWVIIGGESGPGARPMDLQWALGIVDQCHNTGVPVFVQQPGTAAGGREHHDIDTFPQELRLRTYPERVETTATISGPPAGHPLALAPKDPAGARAPRAETSTSGDPSYSPKRPASPVAGGARTRRWRA